MDNRKRREETFPIFFSQHRRAGTALGIVSGDRGRGEDLSRPGVSGWRSLRQDAIVELRDPEKAHVQLGRVSGQHTVHQGLGVQISSLAPMRSRTHVPTCSTRWLERLPGSYFRDRYPPFWPVPAVPSPVPASRSALAPLDRHQGT